jgi:hypothetical protein
MELWLAIHELDGVVLRARSEEGASGRPPLYPVTPALIGFTLNGCPVNAAELKKILGQRPFLPTQYCIRRWRKEREKILVKAARRKR